MFATLFSVALFAAIATQGARAQFTVDTPSLTQCEPAVITWSSTPNPPYNLLVVSSDDPCGDPIVDLGDFYGLTTNWTVNATSGSNVMFSLMDADGDEAWSGSMAIGGSDDSSCLTAAVSSVVSSPVATGNAIPDSTTPAGNAIPDSTTPAGNALPTTLVIPDSATHAATSAHAAASSGAVPVGAANAGDGPKENSAYSIRELSAPMLVLSALAAIALF